jgi:hypothetical protein
MPITWSFIPSAGFAFPVRNVGVVPAAYGEPVESLLVELAALPPLGLSELVTAFVPAHAVTAVYCACFSGCHRIGLNAEFFSGLECIKESVGSPVTRPPPRPFEAGPREA